MKKIYTKILPVILASVLCMGAGYKGTLPDIKGAFEHLRDTPQKTTGFFNDRDSDKEGELKKIPRENKAYIDIILKKDRTSPYTKDLNDVIILFDKMDKCLKANGNTQKFNAIASSMIDHADFMAKKYADRPERHYISFAKIQDMAKQAGDLASLRCEAQIYKQYLTLEGEGQIYGRANVNAEISKFQTELESALQIMKDSK